MSNLSIGELVYWNKNGAKAYWNPNPQNPVEHLSEEFLEGEFVEPIPYQEQYAYDVPNTGTDILPSKLDDIAGTISGEAKKAGTAIYYPINMPFTFYNLDGTNHNDSSKTLKVWVNVRDISNIISTYVSQEEIDKATRNTPKIEKSYSGEDSPLPKTAQGGVNQNIKATQVETPETKKKSIWVYVGIGVGVIILGFIGWLILRPAKLIQQENNQVENQYQQSQNTTLQGFINDNSATILPLKMKVSISKKY